jgi:hypothetical protein
MAESVPDNSGHGAITLAAATGEPHSADHPLEAARVTSAPHIEAAPQSQHEWQQSLFRAISELESQRQSTPRTTEETREEALLRILYLTAGRRDDALRPIPGLSPTRQDFWKEQLLGLAMYMDDEQTPDGSRRAAGAQYHIRAAADKLGELATLEVRNLVFCDEVTGFGLYRELPSVELSAGSPVLLYAEIDNFRSESTAEGYHTTLASSYQILDETGRRVEGGEFPTVEDYCQSPRHDFYIQYRAMLPARIERGRYTLQLTVVDQLSDKIGQSTANFQIK